jgi:hypothetical protein
MAAAKETASLWAAEALDFANREPQKAAGLAGGAVLVAMMTLLLQVRYTMHAFRARRPAVWWSRLRYENSG